MMANHKLKGVLKARDKSSNHGSSSSQSPKQKRIDDLETLIQRLQHCLRIYEDPTTMKTFMDGVDENNTKEEQDDMDEQILQPSQLQHFFKHKKAKCMYTRDYDYHGRYDFYNWNEDYCKRHGNYDESYRFNPKLNIP